ncbi:UbiA family prenyltransferase [Candidatus Woesearchaeota archaeon]|nr:UbiA family prenyltransferase [Candidatus Woesearchaeota archaeon]
MAFADYIRLLRFRYHLSFVTVVISAIYFSGGLTIGLAKDLALLYLSFNLLLYGGIYAINAITDANDDSRHPVKKMRPIPAGKISKAGAAAYASFLIASGMASAYFIFGMKAVAIYSAFIAINIAYSAGLKKVPYLALLLNSSTHLMRLILGSTIANVTPPAGLAGGYWLMAISIGTAWKAAENRKEYSGLALQTANALAIALTAALLFSDPEHTAFYVAFLAIEMASAISFVIAPFREKWLHIFERS